MFAAENGHLEIVQFLKGAGADIHAFDKVSVLSLLIVYCGGIQ
jgi:ankyrin repeat protein